MTAGGGGPSDRVDDPRPQSPTSYAMLDGARIAYETRGDAGTPLVLVHGWGSDRHSWRPQLEGEWPGIRLIAIDLIGHGESDAPDLAYTMDDMARSVAAVLDDLGIDRAVLVGHSMGVPVVRQFWHLFRGRTIAIVAVDGHLHPVPMSAWQEKMLAALKGPGWREAVEQMAGNIPSTPDTQQFVSDFSRSMRRTPQRVLVGTTEAALDPEIWAHYPIDVPLLVITAQSPFGPKDPTAYAASVREVAPLAQVHVWNDASHTLTAEHPARFNELVRSFVNRVAARNS